jgi:hypothetical protein
MTEQISLLRQRMIDDMAFRNMSGRVTSHIKSVLQLLCGRPVKLRVPTCVLNDGSRLVYQVTGAFAEFERSILKQRVNAGLAPIKAKIARGEKYDGDQYRRPSYLRAAHSGMAGLEMSGPIRPDDRRGNDCRTTER